MVKRHYCRTTKQWCCGEGVGGAYCQGGEPENKFGFRQQPGVIVWSESWLAIYISHSSNCMFIFKIFANHAEYEEVSIVLKIMLPLFCTCLATVEPFYLK